MDATLHLHTVDIPGLKRDRSSSFPSDTATLFFGLAAVIFLENRLAGIFCFLWVAVVVAMARVAFGFHYPSDVIGALLLGPAFVLLFTRFRYPQILFERILFAFSNQMYLVHALFFVFLTEASNLFLSVQDAGKELVKMLHS